MKKWVLFLILATATILSFFVDKAVVSLFTSLHSSFLDSIFITIRVLLSEVVIIIAASFLISRKNKIIPLWAAFVLVVIVESVLKTIIARQRPFTTLGFKPLVAEATYSFPSGHLSIMGASFPFIREKIRPYWIATTVLLALASMYVGVHYFSDTIAGFLVGYLISLPIYLATERYNKKIIKIRPK